MENDSDEADFLVSMISTSTSSPEFVSEPFVSDEAEADEPPHESSFGRKKLFDCVWGRCRVGCWVGVSNDGI